MSTNLIVHILVGVVFSGLVFAAIGRVIRNLYLLIGGCAVTAVTLLYLSYAALVLGYHYFTLFNVVSTVLVVYRTYQFTKEIRASRASNS